MMRERESFARNTVDALSARIAILNGTGTIIAVNRAWRDFALACAHSIKKVAEGANYLAVCDAATGEEAGQAAAFAAGIRAVVSGESAEFSLEYPCPTPSGEGWFVGRVTRFHDEAEIRIVVAHEEITARKQMEERLKRSEEWLRAIFEASRDGILVEDNELIVYVNRAYTLLFGYDEPEELVGRHVSVVLSSRDEDRMLEFGRRRVRGEQTPFVYEFKGRRKDGALIDVEASVSTSIVDGKAYITTTIRDIAERKRAEDALRNSEQLLHHLIRNIPNGSINVFDRDLRYLFADGQGLARIGLSPEQLVGRTLSEMFPPEAVDYATPYYRRAFAGEILDFELETGDHWYIIHTAPLEDAQGRINAIIALAQDITGRKQAEERLLRSRDELERRVDERTRDLAHANEVLQAEIVERKRAEELRKELLRRIVTAQEEERRRIARELHDQMGQHLTALMLGLASLKESCQEQPLAHDRLRQLQRLTNELGQEVHHLAWELRPTALDDWGLQTALSNYVEEWSERCRIPVDFHSIGLEEERLAPEIEATIYRMAQEALTNILRHAEAHRASLILERRPGHVIAIVEDDGRGFDTEAVMNTAETKRWLGLLGMKERVALVGGTLQVESTLGAGTTLFVRIPV